jgi:hypothetical protein
MTRIAHFLHASPKCHKACSAHRCTHHLRMDRPTAIQQIREACNALSASVTSIHPLLPELADEPTKSEIIKALFELTKNIETVKKQVMRLEKRDDSALL